MINYDEGLVCRGWIAFFNGIRGVFVVVVDKFRIGMRGRDGFKITIAGPVANGLAMIGMLTIFAERTT